MPFKGFDHEQNRPDRDQYVEILWANCNPNDLNISLCNTREKDECGCDEQITDYDYLSIMHNGSHDYSTNGFPFMIAKMDIIDEKGKNWGRYIPGHRYKLSTNDIKDINDKYGYPAWRQKEEGHEEDVENYLESEECD